MHPADIIAALKKKGFSLTRIAREQGVTVTSISAVVHDRDRSVHLAKRIASIVGQPVNTLWPGSYNRPRPRYRDRIDRQAA